MAVLQGYKMKYLSLILLANSLQASWLNPTHREIAYKGGVTEYGSTYFFYSIAAFIVILLAITAWLWLMENHKEATFGILFVMVVGVIVSTSLHFNKKYKYEAAYNEYIKAHPIPVTKYVNIFDTGNEIKRAEKAREYARYKTR